MAIFKCKMCGGDLILSPDSTIAECEYCGSVQTVPSADNEKKMTLFARANRLRYACEFDKAAGVYEAIVADFPEEAEAYWGLVLCKYGIEYVDDPATAKKVPTCHRSSFDSLMDDSDFEQALENADVIARKIYREEAKQIENIRKRIIEVSSRENPYDIFICYKETDELGNRTLDSVLAQDLYDALTNRGYKVFFSRISLEDKLGQEYEPYIFAALHSAKIMLAIGTDYEYYNAVWVKNEWSRFLHLIAAGQQKVLIPCFKNLDAYDIPKEFAKLQAQDLGKVGATQDLLRGIDKILSSNLSKSTPLTEINTLLERGMLLLEDGQWEKAEQYFDRALDANPKSAEAYLGKMMSDLHVKKEIELINQPDFLEDHPHYEKVMRFAQSDLYERLSEYNRQVKEKTIEHLRVRREKIAPAQGMVIATNQGIIGIRANGTAVSSDHRLDWQLRTKTGIKTIMRTQPPNDYLIIKNDGSLELIEDATQNTLSIQSTGIPFLNRLSWQNIVSSWYNIISVAASSHHIVGVHFDGTVIATGDNSYGQCNVSGWTNIIAVAADNNCTIGLQGNGTVVITNSELYNVSDWQNIVAICIGNAICFGLTSQGTVVFSARKGTNVDFLTPISKWRNIVEICAISNYNFFFGIDEKGKILSTHNFGGKLSNRKSETIAISTSYRYKSRFNYDPEGPFIAALNTCGSVDDIGDMYLGTNYNWVLFHSLHTLKSEKSRPLTQSELDAQIQAQQEREVKEKVKKWKKENRCQHCGGPFKGIFTYRCTKCGKPKDY